MKKLFIYIALFLTTLIVAQSSISKNIGDYSTLKVYNGIQLELIKSDKQQLVITGEKAEKVVVKNARNILKIYLSFPGVLANNKVKAILYYNKNIDVIDANEGATITGKEIRQPKIEIKSQEGAFINLVVNTNHLTVKSISSGVIKLSGTAKNQTVEVNNGGIYHGYNLNASKLTTIKSGLGGKAEVKAGETLDAKISFGGTIFYKGKPKILKTKKVLGGTIEAKN